MISSIGPPSATCTLDADSGLTSAGTVADLWAAALLAAAAVAAVAAAAAVAAVAAAAVLFFLEDDPPHPKQPLPPTTSAAGAFTSAFGTVTVFWPAVLIMLPSTALLMLDVLPSIVFPRLPFCPGSEAASIERGVSKSVPSFPYVLLLSTISRSSLEDESEESLSFDSSSCDSSLLESMCDSTLSIGREP